jgi:hypothetical protein
MTEDDSWKAFAHEREELAQHLRDTKGAGPAVTIFATVETVRLCTVCDGPITRCTVCGHHHCDDDTCPGMPVQCALEE